MNSPSYKKLVERFGEPIRFREIVSLAELINIKTELPLTSRNKRSWKNILKWYDENQETIFSWIESHSLIIVNQDDEIINKQI